MFFFRFPRLSPDVRPLFEVLGLRDLENRIPGVEISLNTQFHENPTLVAPNRHPGGVFDGIHGNYGWLIFGALAD